MSYDSTSDTFDHRIKVRKNISAFIEHLQVRALRHDQSKLEPPEKEAFDIATPKLRSLTYGSEEYKKSLEELGPALEHHYAKNSHHPEHSGYLECNGCFKHHPVGYTKPCDVCGYGQFTFRPDISQMTLTDLMEMLADWHAAGQRHADGSMEKSLNVNKKRFEISDQLMNILRNTAKEQGWL